MGLPNLKLSELVTDPESRCKSYLNSFCLNGLRVSRQESIGKLSLWTWTAFHHFMHSYFSKA